MLAIADAKTMGVEVRDAQTGNVLTTLQGHQPVFDPDGTHIATVRDDTIWVWEAKTGNTKGRIVYDFPISDDIYIELGPNARHIVTREDWGQFQIWDIATGHLVFTLLDSPYFSPDGLRIVTIRGDETRREHIAKVWDASTGEVTAVLSGHDGVLSRASFSPDGRYVLTSSGDGTTRVWLVDIEDLMALAESRVTRNLTCQERQTYLHEKIECPSPMP